MFVCEAEMGKPEVAMKWIYLVNCAHSLCVVDDLEKSPDDTQHRDRVLAHAYHAFVNEYYYDSSRDFLEFCKTGKSVKSKSERPTHTIYQKDSMNAEEIPCGQAAAFSGSHLDLNLGDYICWCESPGSINQGAWYSCGLGCGRGECNLLE